MGIMDIKRVQKGGEEIVFDRLKAGHGQHGHWFFLDGWMREKFVAGRMDEGEVRGAL